MRAYLGVTDGEWYRFLAARPALREVNFWQPFFFKTHYPHNRVVGGGFFSGSARLPMSEAWELFGEANGVASAEVMRQRIGQYRRMRIAARSLERT